MAMNQKKNSRKHRFTWLVITQLVLLSCGQLVASFDRSSSSSSPAPNRFTTIDQLGFLGQVDFGQEPSLIYSETQPGLDDQYPILEPQIKLQGTLAEGGGRGQNQSEKFNVARHWGNLSPMFSLPRDVFGIQSGPEAPPGCVIDQLHLLHRHGARFPSTASFFNQFSKRILAAQKNDTLKADGDLAFLKTWKNKLGSAVLTPFGRSQMFQLRVTYRQKYGFSVADDTLDSDSDSEEEGCDGTEPKERKRKPVFRTTTQHRIYHSTLNFGAGFFGLPNTDKYHQLILVEEEGFNNTLAAYFNCPKSVARAASGLNVLQSWNEIALKTPQKRLNKFVSGFNFSISDIDVMQSLCAYETVALGTSEFCKLFTPEEWLDFSYACDLRFWYSASFGNKFSAALGAGWAELLARLTKTIPKEAKTSINITQDSDPEIFPMNQKIYVDATHDTMIAAVIVALNLTSLSSPVSLPINKRLEPRTFRTNHIVPFGAHLAGQVMTCSSNPLTEKNSSSSRSSSGTQFIRFILNDAVLPLDGLQGCQVDNVLGLCQLNQFIDGLKLRLSQIDFQKTCFG